MEMTCILCPVGCRLTVEREKDSVTVKGNICKRGEQYGKQELINPMRMVTSSVRVAGGAHPLCPVKTKSQVPKAKIPEVLRAIKRTSVERPIAVGQVLVEDIAGTGVALVATGNR